VERDLGMSLLIRGRGVDGRESCAEIDETLDDVVIPLATESRNPWHAGSRRPMK